ncbi:uncharacterized protein METZ01_LOCUS94314 [marine metagenome]|uniref:Uncharacterized protein n=1 Tax=marine metagenome TaxID=408172 RepID=A0A381VMD3_9ZZZZ
MNLFNQLKITEHISLAVVSIST